MMKRWLLGFALAVGFGVAACGGDDDDGGGGDGGGGGGKPASCVEMERDCCPKITNATIKAQCVQSTLATTEAACAAVLMNYRRGISTDLGCPP